MQPAPCPKLRATYHTCRAAYPGAAPRFKWARGALGRLQLRALQQMQAGGWLDPADQLLRRQKAAMAMMAGGRSGQGQAAADKDKDMEVEVAVAVVEVQLRTAQVCSGVPPARMLKRSGVLV